MSEADIRIALAAEGPTDTIVIEAALRSILGPRSFVLQQVQPEGSVAFGETGGGWVGVYRWCKQAAARGNGHLSLDELLFANYDVVVIHLDADVAAKDYPSGSLKPSSRDGALPCRQPCPPAKATTDALRKVLLSWCGEKKIPRRTVLCVPSKSTEAWVVAALFPKDSSMKGGIECFADPEKRLGQQPHRNRIGKNQRDYLSKSADLEREWARIAVPQALGEAARFRADITAAISET